jgi:integrase
LKSKEVSSHTAYESLRNRKLIYRDVEGRQRTENSKLCLCPQHKKARAEAKVDKQPEKHVFTWSNGKPILDFRAAWAKACKAAGAPGLRFHDLRRSATRNIIRKGVAATVAMRITGHLTRAVFDAYDVTADQDLLNTAERI